ncbi:MAG: QueG-associated DUF1730 domain-containing protein [Flavobacteriales bacterium]
MNPAWSSHSCTTTILLKKQHRDNYQISKYVYEQNYHHVLKFKLRTLHNFIIERIGEVHGRNFVDSASVLDKA